MTWETVEVRDLALDGIIYDGPHATPEKAEVGAVFLGIASLLDGRVDLARSARIAEEQFKRWTRRVTPQTDDLVFAYETSGPITRRVALVPEGVRCCLGRRTALIRPDLNRIDPRFLLYAYLAPEFQRTLESRIVHGSTTNRLLLTEFGDFPIRIPTDVDEQKRIAAVLGALDDKIELNRKMNQTLEEMAQAIFKSWFIDFDGVPDEDLVDSELGPIPRGWALGTFGGVAQQYRETVQPDEQAPDTPYIGLADMPQRSITLGDWGRAEDATSAKTAFAEDDILFGKLRPYFKKVGVAPCDGVCSSDIIVVRPRKDNLYGYTLGLLTLDAFIDFTTAVSTGTRMPRTSWKSMSGYAIAMPPDELASRFNDFVRPAVARIKSNLWESRTLAELRDTLLPKLISGEIRVPEAEEQVEMAL